MTVTITSQRIVNSNSDSSWKSLNPDTPFRLGPFDHMVAPLIPIAVLFVYDDTLDVERLEQALARVLDYYPHLTGRLQVNGTAEVVKLGSGAELLVAHCNQHLGDENAEVLMQDLPDQGNALFAPFVSIPDANPLLTLQYTRFACGRTALGVRIYHTLCGAEGFFQLMGDLAELYRGAKELAHPPHITSVLSQDLSDEEIKAAREFKTQLFYTTTEKADFVPSPFASAGRFIRFSSAELDRLKKHATPPDGEGWVSTFDALSAHLFQCVQRARRNLYAKDPSLPKLSRPDFLTSVNSSKKLGFPDRYFPNALATPIFTLYESEALPLYQVAQKVHETTRTPSVAEINGSLRWYKAQENNALIRSNFKYGSGSFMISAWNKYDLYGPRICFGEGVQGRPRLVSTPFTPISLLDGLGYYLPVRDGKGLDLCLSISAPLWELLDQDPEFRRFR